MPTPQKAREAPTTPTRSQEPSPGTLPEETDKALLCLLVSPDRHSKFAQICNSNHYIFGASRSTFRRRVQNRRDFLRRLQKNDNDSFYQLLTTSGIIESEEDKEPYDQDHQQLQEQEDQLDEQQQRLQEQQHQRLQEPCRKVPQPQTTTRQSSSAAMATRREIFPGRFRKCFYCATTTYSTYYNVLTPILHF